MNYIIPKKRLFAAIFSLIDLEMKRDDVDWTYADDEEFAEGYDDNLIEFRGNSWNEHGESMLYIKKEYYEQEELWDQNMKLTWGEKAPILEFRGSHPLWKQLQDVFGELWKPVAEKWFKENYPDFPVKTFLFH